MGNNTWGHEESDTAEHNTDDILEVFLLLLLILVILGMAWKKIVFYLVLEMAPGLFIEMTFFPLLLHSFPSNVNRASMYVQVISGCAFQVPCANTTLV